MPIGPYRDQLQRILASTTFQQVDRLKRFLTFIVGEAIEGRRHELKEYVIGVQVFGKEDVLRSADGSDRPRIEGVLLQTPARRSRTLFHCVAPALDGFADDEGQEAFEPMDLLKGRAREDALQLVRPDRHRARRRGRLDPHPPYVTAPTEPRGPANSAFRVLRR